MKQYRAILDDRNALLVVANDQHEARSIAFGQLLMVWLKTGRMATITKVEEA